MAGGQGLAETSFCAEYQASQRLSGESAQRMYMNSRWITILAGGRLFINAIHFTRSHTCRPAVLGSAENQ